MTTFSAPRWMRNAHVQTLGASLPLWSKPRSLRELPTETLYFPLPEGGALHASAWWQPGAQPRLTVVMVHGVGGSSESKYLLRGAIALHRAGFNVVRLNLRGAGLGVATAPSLAHAGLTADPIAAVEAIAADPRTRGVALLGFSLGGHVALRLAGEWGDAPHPDLRAVVSISAPVDLEVVSHALETRRALPYRAYVLRALIRQARAFARMHPEKASFDPRSFSKMRKVRDFDAAVVAPMHGFSSVSDYYARASAGPWLPRIRVPVLMVHADDDPMVPLASLTPWLKEASPAVRFLTSARGGHVGFFGGLTEESWTRTWAIVQTIAFLRGVSSCGV